MGFFHTGGHDGVFAYCLCKAQGAWRTAEPPLYPPALLPNRMYCYD